MTKYKQADLDIPEQEEDYLNDDSSFTFRVNSELKNEFQKLCKRDRYSSASVIKRYMLKAVRAGDLNRIY